MAVKNGCNLTYKVMLKPQGEGRMNPASFARNNMAKGGVNNQKFLAKSDVKSLGTGKRK